MLRSVVGRYRRSHRFQYLTSVSAGLVLLLIIFSTLSPGFLSYNSVLDMAWTATPLAIVSAGQTLVILAGGADLSVGSMMGLAAICTAALLTAGDGTILAVLGGLVVGLVGGTLNGVISDRTGVPSFVVTFAALAIFQGLAFAIASAAFGGLTGILLADPSFVFLGRGAWLGAIPPSLVIAIAVGLVLALVLSLTRYGLRLRAVGGNEGVAMQAGVSVAFMRISVFAFSGILAALAGLLLAAGNFSVDPGTTGATFEFQSITAVILGGTRLQGGEGGIGGTYLAVVLLTVLYAGVSSVGLDPGLLPIVQGGVLLAVIGTDGFLRHHRKGLRTSTGAS